MKKLSEWQFLVDYGFAEETWTASCAYGSPHLKEFVFLFCHMKAWEVHRPCSKDHVHVKIEGAFTKPSATYVDGLAQELARVFSDAIAAKLRREAYFEPKTEGLESPLCNDVPPQFVMEMCLELEMEKA